MKKLLAALVALVAINASAYDVTNTVTIVSNIYNRISEEHWITNNIKNTHTNYHYTNNFYTVSNVTLLVSQTNVHTTATYDMGRSMLSIMSNDVNSAKASIRSTADEAAGSASRASSSASSASSSAASAQNTLNNVNTRGAEIINGMNAKQNWFDQNYGKMITNHNIYVAEDQVARAGVSENSVRISALNTRMGTAEGNINSLGTRMGTAEGNIGSLGSRMGSAEGGIASLNGSVNGLRARVGTNEIKIAVLNKFAGDTSNRFEQIEAELEIDPQRLVKYSNGKYYDFVIRTTNGETTNQVLRVLTGKYDIVTFSGIQHYAYYMQETYYRRGSYPFINRVLRTIDGSALKIEYLETAYRTVTKEVSVSNRDISILPLFNGSSLYGSFYLYSTEDASRKTVDYYLNSDLKITDSNGAVKDLVVTTNTIPIFDDNFVKYLPGGDWIYQVKKSDGTVTSEHKISVGGGWIELMYYPGYYAWNTTTVLHDYGYPKIYPKVSSPQVPGIAVNKQNMSVQFRLQDGSGNSEFVYMDPIESMEYGPVGKSTKTTTLSPGTYIELISAPMQSDVRKLKFDPYVYDANSNRIGKTVFSADLIVFSNWVEQVFQKK